ncbi:Cysteine-rich RLK 34 putative isoform 3 [Tripterygium wilfordii]|uniref:Cysteine-rich RLK 34 putative isoform 3 n=1 Tax=Tripterygium wilfordii TaxID=458696 RepID=A0A7J7DT39_TRIWF|nr:Cysteine-rich RLK 34 putative isoform 3 [Tripterygium wilfordii]
MLEYKFCHKPSLVYIASSMARKSLILLVLLCFPFEVLSSNSETWIKSGYWYAGTNLPVSDIDSTLFTHLSCAFAYVNSSSYELYINSSHQLSFASFTNIVRRKNPSIFTLLTIWVGKQYSPVFSSMINQSSYRKSFIESSISTARLYGFQGLDFGGVMPDKNTNMTNLGVLLSEWRYAIASEGRKSGNQDLILAMAVYSLKENDSASYPIESMRRNLDWVRVAAYDYYVPMKEKYTGLNAALYGPSGRLNANESIMSWINGGMPANKLVLGLPYHGYVWLLSNSQDNDIGAPASGPTITIDGSVGYKLIKSYIQTYGFGAVSVYNSTYVVNLFRTGRYWANFDDVEAITAKISYAKKMGMLGYAAFQLSNDDNWVLSKTAGRKLSKLLAVHLIFFV